jgi:hypothetical protein
VTVDPRRTRREHDRRDDKQKCSHRRRVRTGPSRRYRWKPRMRAS